MTAPTNDLLTALQSELAELVRREAEAVRASFHAQWQLAARARVEQGRCIDGLAFSAVKEGRFLRFACTAENLSDFRAGDLVRLSRGEPTLPLLTGDLYRVDDDAVWLEPVESWQSLCGELETGRWTLDASYLDLEAFYRDAIADLGGTARGRERILPLLAGEAAPGVNLDRFDAAAEAAEKEGVNEAQSEAIAQAVAADLCHLVQGPPGTGKTFVLAQIVKQRVARGERVLITALTHRAIHNALNMICRVAPEISDVVKIGREIHDPELRVRQYQTFSASPLGVSEGGYVVGATPFSARSKRLRGVEFDAVIIDEASQVTLPLAVMAMLTADAYIFIGDHRQLPPVLQSVPHNEAALASVFGRLSGRGFSTMLEITYRMNAELTRWPGEAFYSGKLRAATANAERRLALPTAPADFAEVLDPAKPLVLVEMSHCAARRISDDEATLAADLIVTLKHAGLALSELAVVVPFRRQAARIRMFLKTRRALQPQDLSDCVIDTVERMQGQERDVIIISMTASESGYVAAVLDFLLQPQRLNVAVTRARSKVIILASEQLALAAPDDPERRELVELWKSLRAACSVIRL